VRDTDTRLRRAPAAVVRCLSAARPENGRKCNRPGSPNKARDPFGPGRKVKPFFSNLAAAVAQSPFSASQLIVQWRRCNTPHPEPRQRPGQGHFGRLGATMTASVTNLPRSPHNCPVSCVEAVHDSFPGWRMTLVHVLPRTETEYPSRGRTTRGTKQQKEGALV